ncbi:MAG: ATPase, partial [Schaalia hyovaginalis]|nr:ATPase [Schaalia hyovaginalis]
AVEWAARVAALALERAATVAAREWEKEEAARRRAAERRAKQVESVVGQVLRTAGREITRSIFGNRRR